MRRMTKIAIVFGVIFGRFAPVKSLMNLCVRRIAPNQSLGSWRNYITKQVMRNAPIPPYPPIRPLGAILGDRPGALNGMRVRQSFGAHSAHSAQ